MLRKFSKKLLVTLCMTVVCMICLSSQTLNNFNVDEYTKTVREEFFNPFPEQHPLSNGAAYIVVYIRPNVKPRPEAIVRYIAKYSGWGFASAIDESESTVRYFLDEYAKKKGYVGAPPSYIKSREPKKLSTSSLAYKDELNYGHNFEGYFLFEIKVEFYP